MCYHLYRKQRLSEVLNTFTALKTSRCLSSTVLPAAGSLTPFSQVWCESHTAAHHIKLSGHHGNMYSKILGGLKEEPEHSPDLGAHAETGSVLLVCSGSGQGQSQLWPGWEGRSGIRLELLLFPSSDRLLSFESLLEQNSFVLMILSRSYSSVLSSPLTREGAVLKILFGSHLSLFLVV